MYKDEMISPLFRNVDLYAHLYTQNM